MAVTILTLTFTLTMVGILLSFLVGAVGGKNDTFLLPSVILFFVVLPLILTFLSLFLYPLTTVNDWPNFGWNINPQTVFFVGCIGSGFLGMKAGSILRAHNDKSLIQCTLMPISLLTIVSILLLFLV